MQRDETNVVGTPPTRVAIVCAALAVFTTACAVFAPTKVKGEPWEVTYSGHLCRGTDPIMAVMCGVSVPFRKLGTEGAPDPLTVALVVVAWGGGQVEVSGPDKPETEWSALAAIYINARDTGAEVVEAAVVDSEAPDELERAFVNRYRAARARVIETVQNLGEHWRAVFVDPALQARADRAGADDVLAAWGGRWEELASSAKRELLSDSPSRAIVGEILEFRRSYSAECAAIRGDGRLCLRDPIGTEITLLLVRLGAALGDSALQTAETALDQIVDNTDPRRDQYCAARRAFDDESARHREWDEDRAAVGDEAILAEKWPQAPYDLDDVPIFVAPEVRTCAVEPNIYVNMGSDGAVLLEGVRAVTRRKGRAIVTFAKRVHQTDVATGCYETSRVESVEPNGRVNYRVECTGSKTIVDDQTPKPVDVPWTEAAELRRGDRVLVVLDLESRHGYVVWAAVAPQGDVPISEMSLTHVRGAAVVSSSTQ